MRIRMLLLLLVAAHFNLTGLVPLKIGDVPPPWWVGGRLIWPFALETHTLIPAGDGLNTLTPILSITSAICFLLAAAVLLWWSGLDAWFPRFIVVGVLLSLVLQTVWFTGWAVLPLLVDAVLLWAIFGKSITVGSLR